MLFPFVRFVFSVLILFFSFSVTAAMPGWNASGIYGELQIGVDPKTNVVTGYYVSGTGVSPDGSGPQFSCIFYLTGKKEGEKASVETYFPGDKKREIIPGELQFLPEAGIGPALRLKMKALPGGCAMVAPTLKEGEQMTRTKAGEWVEIRVVKAKRAHFFESPEAVAPRKTYVVQGDGVQVYESRPGWVLADFEGRNKGWLKEEDLYSK